MGPIDVMESERLQIQGRLDAAKSQAERNRLGQFATPTALASHILQYAKTLLPARHKIRFMDPAFGTGAFYSALLKVFPPAQIQSATGYEIDLHYGRQAAQLWGDTALDLRIADFTRAKPPADEAGKPNLIVCTPPYVRHHHIPRQGKVRLQERTREAAGVSLNGLAGLYCYFLCLCHEWLARDGLAAWLIPSEFMDVNYGRIVKQYLLDRVTLLRIHRFDPGEVQFDDALVSSAVVWYRNQRPTDDRDVEFTYGGTLAEPKVTSRIPASALRAAPKWTKFPNAPYRKSCGERRKPVLADFFTINRGLATGANDFFILTEEKAAELKIPATFLKPILPSPRYLPADVVEADGRGNPVLDRRLFLLSCNLPESEIRSAYPTLWKYVEKGVAEGIPAGYLCRSRSPWYVQEDRPPSLFLCTYMGRRGKRGTNPFRFILNHSKATAANVYLLLYPKPAVEKVLKERPELIEAVWHALSRISAETLIGEGRVYGGGLHKVEPNELANAPAAGVLKVLKGRIQASARQLALFVN